MKAAANYLVYSCPDCGKRIFTQRAFLGRTGTCPLCGNRHPVGGLREAESASDRRGAPRVEPAHRTEVEVHDPSRGPLEQDELAPLLDLSATGVGFTVRGIPDPRQLSGFRPPAVSIGDVLELSLHSVKIGLRPKVFRVEVRRVVPGQRRGQFTVGAQFVKMSQEQEDFLNELLAE